MNFHQLPDYLRWANTRMLESMKTAPTLEPRAWEIATHLLEAETLWIERLHGRVSSATSWPTARTPAELSNFIERNAAAYADYLARLGESNPASPTPTPKAKPSPTMHTICSPTSSPTAPTTAARSPPSSSAPAGRPF